MTPKLFIAGIVMAALAVTAVTAEERGPGKRHQMSFGDLDADGNGEVTKAELDARNQARFAKSDTNGDGLLSRDEMAAASGKRAEKRVDHMLKRFDANGDGALSLSELPGMPDDAFARADADSSGGLSEAEFAELKPHGKKRKPKN